MAYSKKVGGLNSCSGGEREIRSEKEPESDHRPGHGKDFRFYSQLDENSQIFVFGVHFFPDYLFLYMICSNQISNKVYTLQLPVRPLNVCNSPPPCTITFFHAIDLLEKSCHLSCRISYFQDHFLVFFLLVLFKCFLYPLCW